MNLIIKLFFIVLLVMILAQVVSFIIKSFKHKNLLWFELINTGGFPSSHSAFVSSVTTCVYLVEGLSLLFLVSLIFSLVVLRDAVGVRNTVGKLSKEVNRLIKKKKYNESSGHSLFEVISGVVFGIILTLLFYFIF